VPVRRSIGQKPQGSDMVAAGIVDVQDGLVGGEGEAVGREKIVGQQPPCQDYRVWNTTDVHRAIRRRISAGYDRALTDTIMDICRRDFSGMFWRRFGHGTGRTK
jgi:hypothetical protein